VEILRRGGKTLRCVVAMDQGAEGGGGGEMCKLGGVTSAADEMEKLDIDKKEV